MSIVIAYKSNKRSKTKIAIGNDTNEMGALAAIEAFEKQTIAPTWCER